MNTALMAAQEPVFAGMGINQLDSSYLQGLAQQLGVAGELQVLSELRNWAGIGRGRASIARHRSHASSTRKRQSLTRISIVPGNLSTHVSSSHGSRPFIQMFITVFANYAPSLTILIAQGISLSIVFGCAFMLWWAAKAARDTAKQNLADGLIRAKDAEGNVYFAEQLESLLDRVDQLREGAFGPLTQQPLVKALLFPLSGAGWLALIDNGILPGL